MYHNVVKWPETSLFSKVVRGLIPGSPSFTIEKWLGKKTDENQTDLVKQTKLIKRDNLLSPYILNLHCHHRYILDETTRTVIQLNHIQLSRRNSGFLANLHMAEDLLLTNTLRHNCPQWKLKINLLLAGT